MKRFISMSAAKRFLALVVLMLLSMTAMSAEPAARAESPSALSSPALYIMLAVIVLLLIAILIMGEAIKASARIRKNRDTIIKVFVIAAFTLALPGPAAAETAPNIPAGPQAAATVPDFWGLDGTTFFALCAIITFELVVLFILRNISLQLLRDGTVNPVAAPVAVKAKPRLMEKLNASIPIEKEEEIMLDHDYDGIRELDNNLPPWWKYGFYVSIIFSVFYLIHYHITGTGKLQLAEYEAEMKKASEDLAEYRKNAANQVSEANVTLLTDGGSLSQGKGIFMNNCAACHGKAGEGGVGPNLTDDYWLHSGSIKDVFISVKYGWPEKGMKAWEQDLTPVQMHQVSSYIKSLRGTSPANAKEKQGELFIEDNLTSPATDSTTLQAKTK